MLADASLSDLITLALLLAGGGALTGLLSGIFGIGGGAVIVPVMYALFGFLGVPEDVRMHLCIGTSLCAIVPTTWRSYRAHKARGAVDGVVIRRWAVPVLVGALLGAAIAAVISSEALRGVFAAVCGFNGLRFLLGRSDWRLGDELPGRAGMSAYGVFIGAVSALMGISGGQFIIMIMSLYNRPIHQAIATSAGLGIVTALVGTAGFMVSGLPHQDLMPFPSVGYVSLLGAALVAGLSVWTAPLGVRIAHAVSKRRLEMAFGVYLVLIALRFVWSLID